MQEKRGVSIWNLIIALTIAFSVMPVVSRFISSYLTTYFYLIVIALIFFVVLFGNKIESLNEYLGVLLPFILFQCLSFFTWSESIVLWAYSALLSILPVLVGYYITQYHKEDIKFFAGVIILSFLITAITTIVGLIQFPFASRILATTASAQDAEAITYDWHNIGGYSFIYMLVLLYPILIMAFKQKKINFVVAIIGTVLIYTVVVLSEYTTALLLLMISTLLYFVKRNLKKKDVFILLAVEILFVVFFGDYVSEFLSYIASLTGSNTMSERLNSLAGGQKGLESSESNRIFLYQRSLNTFFSHPLLGTFTSGGGGVGGHSFIFDTLGTYGLVGAALLFSMYRKVYRLFVLPFKDKQGFGYVLWTFLQVILLSCVNTGMWLEVTALFTPILASWICGSGDVKDENTLDS